MRTLNDYAKEHCIKYRAAWNRFNKNQIKGAFNNKFNRILIHDRDYNASLNILNKGMERTTKIISKEAYNL